MPNPVNTMDWLPSNPTTTLPDPIPLKKTVMDQEAAGIDIGDWIQWENKNPQLPINHFLHRDWYHTGFGFEGTKNMVYSLYDYIEDKHRYNLRGLMDKKKISWDDLEYSVIAGRYPKGRHSAFYTYYGGTPCLMWQDPRKGWWTLANWYGTIQGIDVKIHKSVEWQLRSKTMVGFIYWYGKDRHSRSVSKKIILQGKTGWNWDDVDIMLWGFHANKFERGKKGITLLKDKYMSLNSYAGKMHVGKHDVIPNDLLSDNSRSWHKWLVHHLKMGRSIGWEGKNGFVLEAGKAGMWENVTVDDIRGLQERVWELGKI